MSKRNVAMWTLMVSSILMCRATSAQFIQYMDFPAGIQQGDPINLPVTLNVPCYGRVQVTIAPNPPTNPIPTPTFFHQAAAANQSPQNAPQYSWGADTDRFNVLASGGQLHYTVTFTFLDGPADASRLVLVVVGLASTTTATITTVPPTSPGTLLGEFRFSSPTSSTTVRTGNVLSSANDGDHLNTGWALYQPPAAMLTSISVEMNQESGDGVGWTLAYFCAQQNTATEVPVATPPVLALLCAMMALIAMTVLRR